MSMPSPMKLPREMSPAQFTVKIGPQELGHIITLRKNLDHMGVLARFAEQYLKLGWPLAALEAHRGCDLGLDFTLTRNIWFKRLMDESLKGHEVNLAVPATSASRLFAIKIHTDVGRTILDPFGAWQSGCIALAGSGREQHFFVLPATWRLSSFSLPDQLTPAIEVLGEGGLALAPPSREPSSEDTWRWLKAPWETPPCLPPAGLCRFLKKNGLLSKAHFAKEPLLPSWKEIFARISRHQDLLRALVAPQTPPARYYHGILKEALKAGLKKPELLQGLLWHAPHGDVRRRPERWFQLQRVVARVADISPAVGSSLPVKADFPGPTGSSRPSSPGPKRREETAHRKSLLEHLERLTARTLELERQLAALQRAPNFSGSQPPGHASQTSGPHGSIPLWEEWLALIRRPSLEDKEVKEFHGAVANFLTENRDLAGDEGKIQLVLYCYANYIKIDPYLSGLPPEQRLTKAGEIARSILLSPGF